MTEKNMISMFEISSTVSLTETMSIFLFKVRKNVPEIAVEAIIIAINISE